MGPVGDLSLGWLLSAAPQARRFGVEHEFSVSRGACSIDFRGVLSSTRCAPGRRLDRADPFARRLSWGGVVTADGCEAECATPPALLVPGFTDQIRQWTETGRLELQLLAEDAVLSGYSTHLNVEVEDRRAVVLADRFAARHSAAMMLLMDRTDSPGLLVRPRRSRLELGGEYLTDHHLVAASVFAAAAARECESNRSARSLAAPRVVPARGRFGLFVDRGAFGADLTAQGRTTRLGRRHSAQDLLTWSWERCRPHALCFAAAHEVGVVDAVVSGTMPLPSEHHTGDGTPAPPTRPDGMPQLDVTVARRSGAMRLDPVMATWDHVCFALRVDAVSRIVAVPAASAALLVDAFEGGRLDSWCRRVAAADPRTLAVLSSADQIGGGSVFSSIDQATTLMPLERNPRTGRPGGVGNPPGQRQQKNHDETPPRRVNPKHLAVAAAAGLAVIAGAVALANRDDTSANSTAISTVRVETAAADSLVATTVAAAAVPETTDAAASTTATPTTLATPICSASDLAPTVSGASGSGELLLPGAVISTDGTGYAEVQLGATTSRVDAGTTLTCTDATTLIQTGGRTWTRTGTSPVRLRLAQGDLTIAPDSVAVVDCRSAAGCTVLVLQGTATLPGDAVVAAPSVASLASPVTPQALAYDAVFGDPWIADNSLRDVSVGHPSPTDLYQTYGPATASLTGEFTGQRTVVSAECTAGPCDVGAPVGDVAARTYDFGADCTNFPCTSTVRTQFTLNGGTQVLDVPLTFDGTNYTWDVNTTTYQCTFDTDGNGTPESRLGTIALTIHYVLTPTAAEVRNGQYLVTAFHAIGDATNTVAAADPRCAGFGPSHNVGDITASR